MINFSFSTCDLKEEDGIPFDSSIGFADVDITVEDGAEFSVEQMAELFKRFLKGCGYNNIDQYDFTKRSCSEDCCDKQPAEDFTIPEKDS